MIDPVAQKFPMVNIINLSYTFYFLLSSEINAYMYQKQIKVISITSEMICYQSINH